jgi:hypothetical protein
LYTVVENILQQLEILFHLTCFPWLALPALR